MMIETKTKDTDMEAVQALEQPIVETCEIPFDIVPQLREEKEEILEGLHVIQGFIIAGLAAIPLWIAIIYFLGKVFGWF